MRNFKILSALIFLLIISTLLTGCDFLFGDAGVHLCEYSEWETAEEATCSNKGVEERFCYYCDRRQTRSIDKLPHTKVDFEGKEATCAAEGETSGIYCSECLAIISGIQPIPKKEHTIVVDAAVEPTDTAPGKTEGSHCSSCGEIIVKQMLIFVGDFSDDEKYHGDYAYESLSAFSNGEAMAEFYMEIDSHASEFHNSLVDAKLKENSENGIYYLADIVYSDNGITKDEALTVLISYIKDHPLYYWISGSTTYTSSYITLAVDPEYIDGDVREELNFSIYKKVESLVKNLNGETEIYDITLGLHDQIISGADYAYQDDGITPSVESSAHNIVGVLLEGEGVCESYAKTFQLLLNFYGIENVYVTGYAGEPHGWNLVKLDDGEWYWYDLTWDDQPKWGVGISYNYFCISNSEYVKWTDGGTSKSTLFLEDHTPDAVGGQGINYNYDLPKAAAYPYTKSGLMLRDELIEQDGLSYVLTGYNTVALIGIAKAGDIIIPESISHNGESLTVTSIGAYDIENRVFIPDSIIEYNKFTREHTDVTGISIPKTVLFIWDFAFDDCYTIESYNVSEDNPAFASKDGVLFTKSLYTLIKYPLAKNLGEYTIPASTVEIAYGSFGDGGNVFCPKHLEKLTIPQTVEVIGAGNGGRGFRDSKPENASDILVVGDYLSRLRLMLVIRE